jgi:hypothetical protein
MSDVKTKPAKGPAAAPPPKKQTDARAALGLPKKSAAGVWIKRLLLLAVIGGLAAGVWVWRERQKAGERDGRELGLVERTEDERAQPLGFEARESVRPALGVGERVLDREDHVVRRQLRDDAAVPPLDQRMDDRLRVDDDGDLLGADVEEPAGLDQLEPLVDQGRGFLRREREDVAGATDRQATHLVRHQAGLLRGDARGAQNRFGFHRHPHFFASAFLSPE